MSSDALHSATEGMRTNLAMLASAADRIAVPAQQPTSDPVMSATDRTPATPVAGSGEASPPGYSVAPLAYQMIQVLMAQRGFEANAAVVGRAVDAYRSVLSLARSTAAHS